MGGETFSQVEKYEALATKLGATAEHIEGARFKGEFTLATGDTLGKKLLDQYGNNAEGKKKMASMLVQLAKAGFIVDSVKAGEKLSFDGPTFTLTKHNGEKLVYNLDQPRQEVSDQTRQAVDGVRDEVQQNPECLWHSGTTGSMDPEAKQKWDDECKEK